MGKLRIDKLGSGWTFRWHCDDMGIATDSSMTAWSLVRDHADVKFVSTLISRRSKKGTGRRCTVSIAVKPTRAGVELEDLESMLHIRELLAQRSVLAENSDAVSPRT